MYGREGEEGRGGERGRRGEGDERKEMRGEGCACMCERAVADAHSSATKLLTDFMVQDGYTSFS